MIVDKNEVLDTFKKINAIQDEIKDYNSTISDFKKQLADHLQIKPDVVSKAYNIWIMSVKNNSKLLEIDELFEAIR